MATYRSEDIRNVALVGHEQAGKTSLADAMLFKAKQCGLCAGLAALSLRFRCLGFRFRLTYPSAALCSSSHAVPWVPAPCRAGGVPVVRRGSAFRQCLRGRLRSACRWSCMSSLHVRA